MAEALFIHLQM